MPTVNVVQTENGKFKVLVAGIQLGIAFTSRILADQEASKIRKEIETSYSRKRK